MAAEERAKTIHLQPTISATAIVIELVTCKIEPARSYLDRCAERHQIRLAQYIEALGSNVAAIASTCE
jgi:hypothetical protein